MKILADESVDLPVFSFLKDKGYAIDHVMYIQSGAKDPSVLKMAFSKQYILLTVDKDFGELAFRSKQPSHGIVLYRLAGFTNKRKAQLIESVFRSRGKELIGKFTVITKKQIRIRNLIF